MSAGITLATDRNLQRMTYAAVVCALLLHTLVCTCMPLHWLYDAHHPVLTPSSVTAEQWLQNVASNLTHELSHYTAIVNVGGPDTGAQVSDPSPGLIGFEAFLILVAVTPSTFLYIGMRIVADRLADLPYPLDHSPIHGVPLLPPRSTR